MPTYVLPQTRVFQEFESAPAVTTAPLRALIMGPHYQTVRYTEADEKATGLLGDYDPTSETCFTWPGREPGAVVDEDFTRVFIDEALLQYFFNPATGADTINATFCTAPALFNTSSLAKNLIRADATTWVTTDAEARDTALRNRDVKPGDIVKVTAVVDSTLVEQFTYVAGFASNEVAAAIAAAVEDDNNISVGLDDSGSSSTVPGAVVSKVGFATNDVDVTAFSDPANRPEFAYQDGVQADIYTFEVTTSGDPTAAVIQVTTESGTDDVDDLVPSAYGVGTPFGDKGLSITFDNTVDNFEVGMKWEVIVEFGLANVDSVSGGTYTGPDDTTYIIEVTRGGAFDGAENPPQITVTTITGSDATGPHIVSALDAAIEIGSFGVTITFTSNEPNDMGLYVGDKYYINVVAASAGPVRTLILGNNLVNELVGLDEDGVCTVAPDLAVTLYIKKNIEVPEGREGFAPIVNWTQSATEICLQDGIISFDASWVDDDDELLSLPVKDGIAFAHFRALLSTFIGTVNSATSGDDTDLGPADKDNPLAFGVFLAQLMASSTEVKFIATAGTDLEAFRAALSRLTERSDVYTIVPLTFDQNIKDTVVAHVNAMSAADVGRWRVTIVGKEVSSEQAVITVDDDGGTLLATISDDPDTSGDQFTLVEIANDVELVGLARPGDILRTNYTTDGFGSVQFDEFTIDVVLTEQSVRLASGPDVPVTVAQRVEIFRNLTSAEHSEEIAEQLGTYGDRRVCELWPDSFERDGESLPAYFLGCIIAGQRSGVVPHQGLTKVEIIGVSSVSRTTMFSRDELNTIAAAGVYIITQDVAGNVFCRHAVTTDMTDINTREEIRTRNADSISYVYLDALAPFIGTANLTPSSLVVIRDTIESTTTFLRNDTQTPTLGSQVIDALITTLEQDELLKDRLNVFLDVELPFPLNNIDLHLVI